MKKEDKAQLIAALAEEIAETPHIYLTDASRLTVAQVNTLRRMCYAEGIRYKVVKNTLIRKALASQQAKDLSELPKEALKGFTGLFFERDRANACAQLIKAYRKQENLEVPLLKAACIDQDIYSGEAQLDALASLKSKQELLAEVLALLRSPVQRVVSALRGGTDRLSAALQVMADKKPPSV